jgi:hypothetical protein
VPAPENGVWNVLDFGALADGNGDNTQAFQNALDAAQSVNGGIVEVPPGRYRFAGSITVPSNVTLRGVYSYAPSHAGLRDKNQEKPVFGSVLEPTGGAGSEDGDTFITLRGAATLRGFTVHYVDQDPKAEAPTPYPYAIRMRGNNPAVIDVQLLNPFNGIDARFNQRALIRNVHGQPIHIGIYVDQIYDIGRIENVHWNPWWSHRTPVFEWQMEHGIGFLFGRTDWHYVLNTFCFGYNVGYKFIETEKGATNGNFLGIGADDCYTAVVVEQSAPMGILITNGEFVSFHGPDPTMVRVSETHSGTVRFNNCAFWGPGNRNALIDGHGTVGFSDCTFMQWAHHDEDVPSLDLRGGSVLVRGCEFLEDKKQIIVGEDIERAVITGNLMNGDVRIEDHARRRSVIKDNVGMPDSRQWRDRLRESPGFRAQQLREAEE